MTQPLAKKLYDNCVLQNPAGVVLCRCDARRAGWYVRKSLAAEVEPGVFRLSFEPKGLGNAGDPFYLAERVNVCVACGSTADHTRHHIVPLCFRRHFPLQVKSHNSYDIVVLCVDCHRRYEAEADHLRTLVGAELGVTYVPGLTVTALQRVRRHASALLFYRDRLRGQEDRLWASVRRLVGARATEDDLMVAAKTKPDQDRANRDYGRRVVERLPDIQAFVERWRRHFLETLNPQHMPAHWSVTRPVEGLTQGETCAS